VSIFRYNSNHKVITALIVVGWVVYHFLSQDFDDNKYNNGQIKRVGSLVNNRNHGTWTWYYDNGKKEMEGTFVEGQREGIWIVWNRNGIKLSEGEYHKDKLNGQFYKWNNSGELIDVYLYKDDLIVQKIKP